MKFHSPPKILLATLISSVAALVHAEANPPTTSPPTNGAAPATPSQITAAIHRDNQTELHFAAMAAEKSNASDVRSYAELLARELGRADQDLSQMAARQNLTIAQLPEDTDDVSQQIQLKAASGNAFDLAFMRASVMDHQRTIELISSALIHLPESDLRAYLVELRSTLQKHVEVARLVRAELSPTE